MSPVLFYYVSTVVWGYDVKTVDVLDRMQQAALSGGEPSDVSVTMVTNEADSEQEVYSGIFLIGTP